MRFTLRSTPASPFGRKVEIAAAVLGLSDDIAYQRADTMDAGDSLRRQNPLGKVPALIVDDGLVLYDSRVIIEYLDAVAGGGRVIPSDTTARFEALRLAALADGILDAAILIVYEGRFRPGQPPFELWLDHQRGKIRRALAAFEAAPPAIEPVTVAPIGCACALGYLDFRKQLEWRPDHPGLVDWLDTVAAAVPAYGRTMPTD